MAAKEFGRRVLLTGVALLAVLLSFSMASGSQPTHLPSIEASKATPTPAASGTYFDYVLIIVLENHNICDIVTTCGGAATYMTSLANAYGLAWQDTYCNVNPSLPNYLCLTGGTHFGCPGYDGGPNSNACTGLAWTSPNIVDRVVGAGLTWKAYMEDMPSNCYSGDSGAYAVRHNPFVYYDSIASNATRCSRVVPAGSSDSVLLNDLGSTSTASNYMWLTPNVCNDMHDCNVTVGDQYLGGLIPQILASNVFQNGRAALLVTFDEGYGYPVYTAWAGPVVKRGFQTNVSYNHYSLLATVEANWNLPPLTANDTAATPMTEFFSTGGPDFSLSASPAGIAFVAGQNRTSTVSLHSTGGFSGNVALSTQSNPAGVTGTCTPPSLSGNGTSVCTFSSSTPGSYTATVVGTNGTLSRSATIYVTVLAQAPPGPSSSHVAQGTRGDAGWYVSDVTVTLIPFDSLGPAVWVQYRIDSGSWTNYSAPFTVGEGRHTLEYYAIDGYGSPPEAHHTTTINVDRSPPALGGIGPPSFVASEVTLTWTGSDAVSGIASYQIRADGGPFDYVGATPRATIVLADGTHTIEVRAMDFAGNTVIATGTVRVDTNIFSPSGPFLGIPTYAIVVVAILAVIVAIRRRRGKRAERDDP